LYHSRDISDRDLLCQDFAGDPASGFALGVSTEQHARWNGAKHRVRDARPTPA
jgi:hypothetical protein